MKGVCNSVIEGKVTQKVPVILLRKEKFGSRRPKMDHRKTALLDLKKVIFIIEFVKSMENDTAVWKKTEFSALN